MRPVMDDVLRLILSLVAAILIAIAFAALFFGLNACSPKSTDVVIENTAYGAALIDCNKDIKKGDQASYEASVECRAAVAAKYRAQHGLPLLDGGAHD